MDTTTKKWILVPTILTLALALIALGFAAMSTSPNFAIPSWLPMVFFTLAGVIIIWLFIYLIRGRNEDVKLRLRRKAIADKLAEFCLSGEEIKAKFKSNNYIGDAVALASEWSESIKSYFLDNPNELGAARLLLVRPRQFDWFVYGQFDPLGQVGKQDGRTYAFRHISIEIERLADLIGEFLR
ncbi:MAG: hypothetical protein ABR886_01580 [Dehalococcoidales bacterium]|jgi:hypothetical protein